MRGGWVCSGCEGCRVGVGKISDIREIGHVCRVCLGTRLCRDVGLLVLTFNQEFVPISERHL